MKTFGKWGPDYNITIKMKLVQSAHGSKPNSLIHLTRGEDHRRHGDRIPAVFLKGKEVWVYITNYRGHTEGEYNYGKKYEHTLILNQWQTLQLNQKQTGFGTETYVFEFLVDGSLKWSQNTLNKQYQNIKQFQSDPWYDSAERFVEVKHISIWNGAGELTFLRQQLWSR